MTVEKIVNIFGAIVTLAMITTVVSHGSETAAVVRAFGDTFANSLRAGMGR